MNHVRESFCAEAPPHRGRLHDRITPGLTALTYRDGSSPEISFTTEEIVTDETALGTLVSVALQRTIDTGGERFGFFLPQLDVPEGGDGDFETVGIYERFSGPDSDPPAPALLAGHRTARVGAECDRAPVAVAGLVTSARSG